MINRNLPRLLLNLIDLNEKNNNAEFMSKRKLATKLKVEMLFHNLPLKLL